MGRTPQVLWAMTIVFAPIVGSLAYVLVVRTGRHKGKKSRKAR